MAFALPGITYGAVPDSSGTAQLPYRAAKEALDETSKLLYQQATKTVEGQAADATLKLTTGLNDLKKNLGEKNYYTAEEVRAAFGGREPPGVKLSDQGLDIATGQTLTVDRTEIPSWEVADLIYREHAKRIATDASQAITIPGWRAEFQGEADKHIEAQRGAVVAKQVELNQKNLEQQALNRIDAYRKMGTAEGFAYAEAEVARSPFTPAIREKFTAVIEQDKQEHPYRQAILEDVTDEASRTRAIELQGQLKLEGALPHLDVKEKAALRGALEAQVRDFDKRLKEDKFRVADEKAKNDLLGFMIRNPNAPIPLSALSKYIGNVSAPTLEHLMALSEKTRQEKDTVTDPAVYQYISTSITSDMEGFKSDQIRMPDGKVARLLDFSGRLSRANLLGFIDLQRTVREKGAEAARGFIDDKSLVDSVLAGPDFKYDLKTTDEAKVAEIGFLKMQADIALTNAMKKGPIPVADRYTIVKRSIAENLQTRKTWGGLGPNTVELKAAGVDPSWLAEYRRSREQAGMTFNADHAKANYEVFSTWQEGLSAAWKAQTGEAYLPMEKAVRIFDYAFAQPGNTTGTPGITAPLITEIDAELEKQGILRSKSNDHVNRSRAALAVMAYLKAIKGKR